jgi:hypothetical protein
MLGCTRTATESGVQDACKQDGAALSRDVSARARGVQHGIASFESANCPGVESEGGCM